MRRSIIYIIIGVALLTACSHVADDERFIYVPPTDVARAVLIEDFTGQRCVNCPDAADTIRSLQSQYGDSVVIAVAIHGGPLAFAGNAANIGLLTDEGDRYVDYWGVSAFPMGLVNRSGAVSNIDQWPRLVREAAAQPAAVELSGATAYDAATRQLTVTATALGLRAVPSAKLQLWLTENSITAMQLMPDGTLNRDYRHNHVFRTSINGTWGEDLPLAEGEERTVSHAVSVSDEWNADRLSVVAFVYDATGVLQVIELRIKS